MSYQQHTNETYQRRCYVGHTYSSADQAARFTTRKGTPRYFCPQCLAGGKQLPKGWKRVEEGA